MCGIFGFFVKDDSMLNSLKLKKCMDFLFKTSESRGKEASGIAIYRNDNVKVYKDALRGAEIVRNKYFKQFFLNTISHHTHRPIFMIGHTRLDTNGDKYDNANNCPIDCYGIIGVHNGIVTNVDELCNI